MCSIPLDQAQAKVENRILHYSFLPKRDFVRCISQTWIPPAQKLASKFKTNEFCAYQTRKHTFSVITDGY